MEGTDKFNTGKSNESYITEKVDMGKEKENMLEMAQKLERSGYVPDFFYGYADYANKTYEYLDGVGLSLKGLIPHDEMIRLSCTLTAYFTGNIVVIDNPEEFDRMRKFLTQNIKFYVDNSYMSTLSEMFCSRTKDFDEICGLHPDDVFEKITEISTRKVAQLKGSDKYLYIINIEDIDEYINKVMGVLGIDGVYKAELIRNLRILSMIEGYGADKLQKNLFCWMSEYTKDNKEVYTYIIKGQNGIYKIGCTSNIKKRFSNLMVANPSISIEFVINKNVEKKLHDIFACKNVSGEWFNLSKKDLEYIKKEYKEYIKFDEIC